jgi:hypothetical protein
VNRPTIIELKDRHVRESDYVKALERELTLVCQENSTLRSQLDSAERKLRYMDQHYIPKNALIRGVTT